MKPRKGFDKSILLLLAIVLVIIVTFSFFYFQVRTDKISDSIKNGEHLNILFLIHEEEQILFSEVFFYHPSTGKGAILDIPRETGSIISEINRIDRIETLFDIRHPNGYIEKIEELIDMPVGNYIQLDLQQVSEIVDLFEGLDMFIANPVEIVEKEKMVLLPSGSLTLDGDKTRIFLSYGEEGETETERIGRRQKFIQSLLKSPSKRKTLFDDEKVVNNLYGRMKTDLSKRAVVSLFREMSNLDAERLIFQRVLGLSRRVDDNLLLFPHYEGNLLKETVKQTIDSISNTEVISDEELRVTIEILNGTTVTGLAGRTAQVFESYGYDVKSVANAETQNYQKTIILDRTGNIANAQRVASLIHCNSVETRIIPVDPDLELISDIVDVTIIIGADFNGRYCKE
ncbi:MAG: LCP family protein [Spirochaetales bacterium]|nr:LCP family protein [Spirochaetales bacterium]